MVKYGAAVLGAEGAAEVGSKLVFSDMAKLETKVGAGASLSSLNKVQSLVDQLRGSLGKTLEACGKSFSSNVCRGTSGTLQSMLGEKGLQTEAISNGFHTFLRIQNFYGSGRDLYIDPTYLQFAKTKVGPEIFVGSKDELVTTLKKANVSASWINDYFEELRIEPRLPDMRGR